MDHGALQNELGAGVFLNNNGENQEGEEERYKEEEEDIDEVMKDEEEESETSSCLIHCRSSDTPMTDSSYSETGSLLENPFSPGTSPEPTSPVIQEMLSLISPLELGQSDVDVGGFNVGPLAYSSSGMTFTTGPVLSSHLSSTSDTGLSCTDGFAHIATSTARSITSTSEPLATSTVFTCTSGSAEMTSTSRPNASITSVCQTIVPLTFTTGQTESSSSTGSLHSENYTSSPMPTCRTTRPVSSLMGSLEQLAHRGDDARLPLDLHQIAEASVRHEDYQLALRCIQLERLYHQRVLDNLNALQQQWESLCARTSPSLEARHLDTLRDICQTHTRPSAVDAVSLDFFMPAFELEGALPSHPSAQQTECRMQQRFQDSSCPQTTVAPSANLSHQLNSPDSSEKDREHPECNLEGRVCLHRAELTEEEEGSGREQGECPEHTNSAERNMLHPSEAGEMDQTKPAEQQGGDSGSAQEKEVDREEEEEEEGSNVGETAEALIMEDETEEEGEKEKRVLKVETLLSEIEAEVEHLHQEAQEARQHEESGQGMEESNESSVLQDDGHLPQAARLKHDNLGNEEEQEDYEVEQCDIIREGATLDDMARLITVEEISPAYGLISILKKRSLPVDDVSLSASSDSRPDKRTAKKRVRFRVADDGFDSDVRGRDSCLLLFLLCLVTVVISVGGTTLYCAVGDVHSTVCQDFSRNVDFYFGQMQRAVAQIQQWFGPRSPSQ
ncbi:consortin isoform X2 [Dunckerocampus dactyliophorus]|uniref:consortin isoform X2 n=1 Tax=Dunckerocampus dactyliophorus TaxID=161453 RepID=UPI0024077555|nr:consortin isoform X2 [Dunckerocampus dactyliophorus]XP_054625585.1 consortin isoform X2 [Dunckerocampus dactyliophorus]